MIWSPEGGGKWGSITLPLLYYIIFGQVMLYHIFPSTHVLFFVSFNTAILDNDV